VSAETAALLRERLSVLEPLSLAIEDESHLTPATLAPKRAAITKSP